MKKITKDDIKEAIVNKRRKKNILLYEYYKEEFFDKGFSAEFISSKISQDLEMTVTVNMIYNINKRIIKKGNEGEKKEAVIVNVPTEKKEVIPNPEPVKIVEKREFKFQNSDEIPRPNKFDNLEL